MIDPASGEVLAAVPRGTAYDVDQAVTAAEEAYPAWRDTKSTTRGELIHRWAQLIDEHTTELDQLESREVGRPHWGPPPMSRILRFIAGQADKVSGLSLPTHTPDVLGLTLREPYGVVGSVIPWNAPGAMFSNDVGAAIAAGNTIVVKPAEDAPLTRARAGPAGPRGRHPARCRQRGHRLRRGGGRGGTGASADPADELHRLAGDR